VVGYIEKYNVKVLRLIFIASLYMSILGTWAWGATPTVAEQVARLKHGQRIRVEMKTMTFTEPAFTASHMIFVGCLGVVSADSFVLTGGTNGCDKEETVGFTIRFDQAAYVKRDRPGVKYYLRRLRRSF